MSSGLPNASSSLHYLRLGQLTDGMRCVGYYRWPFPGRNPNEGHMDEQGIPEQSSFKKKIGKKKKKKNELARAKPRQVPMLHYTAVMRANVNRECV